MVHTLEPLPDHVLALPAPRDHALSAAILDHLARSLLGAAYGPRKGHWLGR